MKVKEIIELKRAIDSLSAAKTPIWYELGKNKVHIERAVEPLFDDFNKARQLVIDNLAEKDENGQFKIEDNKYLFGNNFEEAKSLLTALENDFLDKDVDLDLHKISEEKITMLQSLNFEANLMLPIIQFLT
jgi:hypothetical protein